LHDGNNDFGAIDRRLRIGSLASTATFGRISLDFFERNRPVRETVE
jgi:hypothetical protein